MVDIVKFREMLLELHERINKAAGDGRIVKGVVIAVREGHMIKKLRDKEGVFLCANYPDCTGRGDADNLESQNRVLLFLLEKVPSGHHTDEEELQHYARMQRLFLLLRDELLRMEGFCGELAQGEGGMNIEWEYDIFGGWNGLSVSLNIEDHD